MDLSSLTELATTLKTLLSGLSTLKPLVTDFVAYAKTIDYSEIVNAFKALVTTITEMVG